MTSKIPARSLVVIVACLMVALLAACATSATPATQPQAANDSVELPTTAIPTATAEPASEEITIEPVTQPLTVILEPVDSPTGDGAPEQSLTISLAHQPGDAVDPGAGTEYLGPTLWGLLQRHADGDAMVPDTLDVEFGCFLEHCSKVYKAVDAAGGTDTDIGASRVPTERLLEIIQMPEVLEARLVDGTPGIVANNTNRATMNRTLTEIIQAYEAGVPASAAIQYAMFIDTTDHRMTVTITATDETEDNKVRKWLDDRNIFKRDSDFATEGAYWTDAMMTAPDAMALADAYPTLIMETDGLFNQGMPLARRHWPQESLDWVQDIMDAVREAEAAERAASDEPDDAQQQ